MICKKPNEPPYGFLRFSFSRRISKTFLIFKFFKFTLFKDIQIDRFLWVIAQIHFVTKTQNFRCIQILRDIGFSTYLNLFCIHYIFTHFPFRI